jgi:hypothetical protein
VYNGEKGTYPDSLDELVANGMLRSMPTDPSKKVLCGTADGKYAYKKSGDGYILAAALEKA